VTNFCTFNHFFQSLQCRRSDLPRYLQFYRPACSPYPKPWVPLFASACPDRKAQRREPPPSALQVSETWFPIPCTPLTIASHHLMGRELRFAAAKLSCDLGACCCLKFCFDNAIFLLVFITGAHQLSQVSISTAECTSYHFEFNSCILFNYTWQSSCDRGLAFAAKRLCRMEISRNFEPGEEVEVGHFSSRMT